MRIFIRGRLQRLIEYIELVLAIVVTVVIIISTCSMIVVIVSEPLAINNTERFYTFLDDALSLIIGIEFLKMIIIPTSDNVIETLLFAVARHIILDHGVDVMVCGILCVAVLFIIKKYLLSEFEKAESYNFKGTTPVYTVNATIQSNFEPHRENESIGEYAVEELQKEGKPVEFGASFSNEDFRIRIGKLNDEGFPKKVIVHPLSHEETKEEMDELRDEKIKIKIDKKE